MLEDEEIISVDKFQAALNSIIEKHNSFLTEGEIKFASNDRVRYQ